MSVSRILFGVLLALTLTVAAACDGGDDDNPTSTPSDLGAPGSEETSEVQPLPTTEGAVTNSAGGEDMTATDEGTEEGDLSTPDRDTTANAEGTTTGTTSDDEMYTITVSDVATDNFDSEVGDPPEGMQWVMVDAMVSADAEAEAADLSAERVFLIDTDGNRYSPEEPEGVTDAGFADEELGQGASMEGSIWFAIPEDATPSILEWCLDEECNEVVQALVEES